MHRSFLLRLIVGTLAVTLGLSDATVARAQTRRARTSPGLILETGAPRAFCDALLFTADGNTVLSTGEDKVVRSWELNDDGFATRQSQVLRWPIYREQRGSIFALTPLDPQANRVAIAGFGNPTNLVAVLDRQSGQVVHALADPQTTNVIWKIAISPDGRHLVYGIEDGGLFRWTLADRPAKAVRFAGSGGLSEDRVRLIAFLDDRHFVTVSRGHKQVRIWDVLEPNRPAQVSGEFTEIDNPWRVVLSPDKRWLAATGERVANTDAMPNRVEVLGLHRGGRAGWVAQPHDVRVFGPPRDDAKAASFARVLAFSPDSKQLAVGCHVAPVAKTDQGVFAPPVRSITHVYTLTGGALNRRTKQGLHTEYLIEQIAFRPGHPNQLATAGGANHELRLYDLDGEKLLDEIKGPGSCIWQVAMSQDGKSLGWREGMNRRPTNPNDRAAGPWRAFTLTDESRKVLNHPPADFEPLPPLTECDGWQLQTTGNDWLWRIHGPDDTDVLLDKRLYFAVENQIPQCYTFLKGTGKHPVRLAIGHQWGISLYELRPNNVRLARMLTGHEGKVMSVAPSPDGKLLFSAGRDQAIACWSLEDWPSQSEMGMTLSATDDGRLRVGQVDPGSPAWEAGLTDGDEVRLVGAYEREQVRGLLFDPGKRLKQAAGSTVAAGKIPYRGGQTPMSMDVRKRCSPEEMIELLRRAEPQREYVLVWYNGKTEQSAKTSLRQRPLWRFFPTRADQGSDWVLWRWRDFYYDTNSANADRYIGWHVNAEDPMQAPRFYPLANFSGRGARQDVKGRAVGFHSPAKVWKTILDTFQAPEKVIFPDIEPPALVVSVVQPPGQDATGKAQDLVVRLRGKPRDDLAGQQIVRASLWVNDTLHDTPITINADGSVDQQLTIPCSSLAQGGNVLTFTCFNRQGGRAEARAEVKYQPLDRRVRTLYGLCVGNNDYKQVKWDNALVKDLVYSATDAKAVAQVLREHNKSRLFDHAEVVTILEQDVTADRIRSEIRRIGAKAQKDDLFVLFLSGHGHADEDPQSRKAFLPGTFFYVCRNFDVKKPETKLTARDLHDLLATIKSRKLLLIDACHSGAVGSNAPSDISEGGSAPFLILSACRRDQFANEPVGAALSRGVEPHGLFTQSLLTALGSAEKADGAPRLRTVTASQLGATVQGRIITLLQLLKITEDSEYYQVPEFTPKELPRIEILCRP